MSRNLVLGNGSMLIALDAYGQVRDFYYPYAGEELQTGDDCVHRIGVWVEGIFRWFDDPSFSISVTYQDETLASNVIARSEELSIELVFTDVIYNERNIFVRQVRVRNLAERKREIKVFFNQQFVISESTRGNTAFYEPGLNALVHHRGRRVFLISGVMAGVPFATYSIGHFNAHGKQGTWRDAEDGILSENPIEHGKVDSTIGFPHRLAAHEEVVLDYWIVAGETLEDVKRDHTYLLTKTPDHLLETTQDYWHAWVNKNTFEFYGMSEAAAKLFKTSLLIMRTHVDNRGGIIASCDAHIVHDGFDTYGYVWQRDASIIADAFTRAGYYEIARRYYEFCRDVISDEGYFYHKYTVSKSLGSSWHAWIKDGKRRLPIQEDETALVLITLWHYYERAKNIELIENIYNPLIKQAAEFLRTYRDPKTNLPRPSYDLWEEKYGVTVFTASTVYGGLRAAERFAKLLGKEQDEARYATAAREVHTALLKHLMATHEGSPRMLCALGGDQEPIDDTFDVSNLYGLFAFGVLAVDDPRVAALRTTVLAELSPNTPIGGVMRHQSDYYYRAHQEVHGNPWFITTLWIAQADIALAKDADDLARVAEYFEWVVKYAQPSGILSEQLDPYTGAQLSVAPLIWSHAQYVTAVIAYLEKAQELGLCKTCYPLTIPHE